MIARALVLTVLAACGWGRAPAPPPDAPARLVSLTPAITETVAHLDALDALVGRSDWCTLPDEVTTLPAVGSALTPNLEALAALRPTAVLVDGSRGTAMADLQRVTTVHELPWLTVGEVATSVRTLGELTGKTTAAAELADRIAALDVAVPDGPGVLLVLGGQGLDGGEVWFVKRNSLHGTALHAAGARNLVDRDVDGAPRLSLEAVVAMDPTTVIVLVPTPVDEAVRTAIVEDWGRLSTVRAVQDGRVGVVGGPTALSTGPSILGTVDALRAELVRLDAR